MHAHNKPGSANTASANPCCAAALDYAARGWEIFPAPLGTKKSHKKAEHCGGVKWGKTVNTKIIRQDWTKWPDANVAVVTGVTSGIFVIEADTPQGHDVDGLASISALEAEHGARPETAMAISPSGSVHRYYKHPGAGIEIKNSNSEIAPGVDIRGDGGMVIAPPSVKPGVGVYKWANDLPVAEAPAWLIKAASKVKQAKPKNKKAKDKTKSSNNTRNDPFGEMLLEADPDEIAKAIADIPNDDLSWTDWNRIMMAGWRGSNGAAVVFAALDKWSQKSGKYDRDYTANKWAEFFKYEPITDIGAGTIFFEARKAREANNQGAANQTTNEDAEENDDVVAASKTGLPTIKVKGGAIAANIEQAEAALLASGITIFQRGGHLVRPITTELTAADEKKTEQVMLRPLRAENLIYLLNRHAAVFQKYDARSKKWFAIDPPDKLANGLLKKDHWVFAEIAGVITAPTLRPDGSVLDQPGFDPATQLYYHPDRHLNIPMISANPSKVEAEAALVLLKSLLTGFPFVSDLDRAVALAALMAQPLRGAFYVAPMTLMAAHQMGTGKSHLVNLASTIATGRPCPVITNVASAEEMEKRLGSLILEGAPIISLDNCEDDLGGMLLCQLTEQRIIRIRILGKTETPQCEYRGTVFGTGNNVTFKADMTRRGLICNLDAAVERPETREFAFDPVAMVTNDRGKYIHAILTISRAWRAAGSPKTCTPIASYERWSDAVREPLKWLGEDDPVKSMDAAREEDPDTIAVRTLLSLWPLVFGMGQFTVAQIVKVAEDKKAIPGYTTTYEYKHPELHTLLMEQAGGFKDIDSRKLGRWLKSIHGKIYGGQRLVLAKEDTEHGHRYRVEFV